MLDGYPQTCDETGFYIWQDAQELISNPERYDSQLTHWLEFNYGDYAIYENDRDCAQAHDHSADFEPEHNCENH